MVGGVSNGAIQRLGAYAGMLDTAMERLDAARAMPVRRFFGTGQLIARQRVLHEAQQAVTDAQYAATALRDIDGVRFSVDSSMAFIDAKLARGALTDVPEFVELVERVGVEQQRIASLTRLVAGLAPDAAGAARSELDDVLGAAIAGAPDARDRLRSAVLAGAAVQRRISGNGSEAWTPDQAVADEIVDAVLAGGDVATARARLHVATGAWNERVFAGAAELHATDPTAARTMLDAVRAELSTMALADDASRRLADELHELIGRNEHRLANPVAEGSGLGYLDHPDYADLGRIQASMRLLRSLDAINAAPSAPAHAPAPAPVAAASPAPVAAPVAAASPAPAASPTPAPVAATATEELAW